MASYGGLRSCSRRTIVLVVAAATYYVALNVALIHELVDGVRRGTGPRPAAAERPTLNAARTLLGTPFFCADPRRLDHEGCMADSMINKASVVLGEQRQEWRAVPWEGPAAPARNAAVDSESGAERR